MPNNTPSSVGQGGICVAWGDNWNTYPQTWVRLDDPNTPWLTHVGSGASATTNSVVYWSFDRGRAYELDKTQAGTGVIRVVDKTGLFDPTLANAPYSSVLNPMKQARISVQNPANGQFFDLFTGFIESFTYVPDVSEKWMVVDIALIDGFEPISRFEVDPDASGMATYAAQQVDDHIRAAVRGGTTWNSNMMSIFSGNVAVQQTTYSPGTSILSVIQDAADAEFPNVSNIYMDRHGFLNFKGRFARFNPTNPSYNINFWQVGDIEASQTFGYAPIAEIEWTRDLKNLINYCLCYPNLMPQTQIPNLAQLNAASITKYGPRVLTIPDLVVLHDNYFNVPARDICQIYAQYFVDNYSTPQNRISKLTFNSRLPGNSAWWQFITSVEINDVVSVTTRDPGGGGFSSTDFFVEGIHMTAEPLGSSYPALTVSLDVSPRLWFNAFPGYTP